MIERFRQWLRRWLGIPRIVTDINDAFDRCTGVRNELQAEIHKRLADLQAHIDDLALKVAVKPNVEPESEGPTPLSGHVKFSTRRAQAQGTRRGLAAYVVPAKDKK
jgi:hypothetical protein